MNKRIKKKFVKELKATLMHIPTDSVLFMEVDLKRLPPGQLIHFIESIENILRPKNIKILVIPLGWVNNYKIIKGEEKENIEKIKEDMDNERISISCENCQHEHEENYSCYICYKHSNFLKKQ